MIDLARKMFNFVRLVIETLVVDPLKQQMYFVTPGEVGTYWRDAVKLWTVNVLLLVPLLPGRGRMFIRLAALGPTSVAAFVHVWGMAQGTKNLHRYIDRQEEKRRADCWEGYVPEYS